MRFIPRRLSRWWRHYKQERWARGVHKRLGYAEGFLVSRRLGWALIEAGMLYYDERAGGNRRLKARVIELEGMLGEYRKAYIDSERDEVMLEDVPSSAYFRMLHLDPVRLLAKGLIEAGIANVEFDWEIIWEELGMGTRQAVMLGRALLDAGIAYYEKIDMLHGDEFVEDTWGKIEQMLRRDRNKRFEEMYESRKSGVIDLSKEVRAWTNVNNLGRALVDAYYAWKTPRSDYLVDPYMGASCPMWRVSKTVKKMVDESMAKDRDHAARDMGFGEKKERTVYVPKIQPWSTPLFELDAVEWLGRALVEACSVVTCRVSADVLGVKKEEKETELMAAAPELLYYCDWFSRYLAPAAGCREHFLKMRELVDRLKKED